jgi:rhamnosyltransferase
MNDNCLCSLVIRSFNEERHIGVLMEGIKRQNIYNELEIIVVDSGSTDATVSIAGSYGAKIVHIEPADFSFGKALNSGCKMAKGKYILFASAHVYPLYTNWVEKMIAPFKDEKVALTYGQQVGNELTKYSEQQLFKKWFPKTSNYHQDIPFCNNANSAIRKELWLQQPFDELLTGLEDLDWASRIQQKGYHIAYEAFAPIVHVHEENSSKIRNRYRREAIALKKIMPSQHLHFLDFFRLTTANILTDSIHALRDHVFLKNIYSIVQFRTMQFWGTYKGFKQIGQIDEKLKQRFYYPNKFKIRAKQDTEPGEKIIYSSIGSAK